MNNYREQKEDYMTEYKERDEKEFREYGDYSARNEYVNEPQENNAVMDDFDKLLYFRNANDSAAKNQAEAKTAVKTVPAPKAQNYVEDDTMPSVTTMQFRSEAMNQEAAPIKQRSVYTYEYEESRIKEDEDKQYKISAKGKVLIAVYALVVITIFALIVINTRLLRTMNSDITDLQQDIQVLNDEQTELNFRLQKVSGNDEIERKAQEMGMVKDN